MRLTVNYDLLVKSMVYASSVSNSTLSLETNKTIVFSVNKDKLSIYGESATIGAVTDIEQGNYILETDSEETITFQLKTKEMTSFLGTFTTDRTYPTDVVFELEGNRLNLTVHEEPLDGQPSYLKNKGVWQFDLSDVRKTTIEAMNIGEGEDPIPTELIQIYVDALFPLLSNADSTMNDGRVNFEDSYVYVFTSRTFALFKNKLPDSFKGLVLGYSGVQLIKQLCSEYDQIFVSKDEQTSRLYVTADNNRIAIKYNRKMPSYKTMMDNLTDDMYIEIDRQMLTSIIRRLKLINEPTNLSIDLETNTLNIQNKRLTQNIPLSDYDGEGLTSFKISVVTDVLGDSILGEDAIYPDDLKISISDMGNSYMIKFSDETDNWFSVFRVMAKQ